MKKILSTLLLIGALSSFAASISLENSIAGDDDDIKRALVENIDKNAGDYTCTFQDQDSSLVKHELTQLFKYTKNIINEQSSTITVKQDRIQPVIEVVLELQNLKYIVEITTSVDFKNLTKFTVIATQSNEVTKNLGTIVEPNYQTVREILMEKYTCSLEE